MKCGLSGGWLTKPRSWLMPVALLVALAIPSVAVSSSRGATEQQQDLAHVDTPLANPSVAICGNLSRRAPTAHIITEFDANVPEPVRVAFQAIAARFEELFVLTTDAVIAVGWADFVPSGGGYPEGAFDFPGAPMQRVIYPQVLVKQIVGPNWRNRGIGIHTRPDDRDGTVIFNPTIKWTFEPGGFFEYIAFHELMHAFGFYSSAGQIGRPPWPRAPRCRPRLPASGPA